MISYLRIRHVAGGRVSSCFFIIPVHFRDRSYFWHEVTYCTI